jgi:MFS family permease
VRQSQALFIGPINSSTGIGYAAISLAFAVGQMMWAISMTAAGAMADRWGPRPVMLGGAVLVAAATAAGYQRQSATWRTESSMPAAPSGSSP